MRGLAENFFEFRMKSSKPSYTEEQLLSGFCDGECAVLTHIEREVRAGIRGFVRKSCPSSLLDQEVEDLWLNAREETWCKVKCEGLRPNGLIGYMVGTGKGMWKKELERRKRSRGLTSVGQQETVDMVKMPLSALLDLMQPALDKLDSHCRDVLDLGVVEGLHLKEVADKTGHTYQGLRRKKSDCIKRLKGIISQLYRSHKTDE